MVQDARQPPYLSQIPVAHVVPLVPPACQVLTLKVRRGKCGYVRLEASHVVQGAYEAARGPFLTRSALTRWWKSTERRALPGALWSTWC